MEGPYSEWWSKHGGRESQSEMYFTLPENVPNEAYGSQISYGKPSILYTSSNLWIISQCCVSVAPFFYSLSCCVFRLILPHSFLYSFSFSLSFQLSHPFIVLALIRLHRARRTGGKSMSCGRADGAAPFKYLMELTGSADLVELRGELKVRFPKAAISTAQLRSTPWSRWLTSEDNVCRIQVLCECR